MDLDELRKAAQGGVQIPVEHLRVGAVVCVEGVPLAVQEPASEVMRLREQALVDRYHVEAEGAGDPVEADMIWIALTGPNGLPVYVDPTVISAITAQREERNGEKG